MPTNAEEIIKAMADDIARESRRGQRPVLVRLGSEVRDRLAAELKDGAPYLAISGPGSESLLGIPVGSEPAIDPAGIAIEYEPKP